MGASSLSCSAGQIPSPQAWNVVRCLARISGFATMTIGSSPDAEELELTHHFRNLPVPHGKELAGQLLCSLDFGDHSYHHATHFLARALASERSVSWRSMFTSFRCFTGECTNDLGRGVDAVVDPEL